MMATNSHGQSNTPADFVSAVSPWVAGLGVLLILLGIIAITHPAFTAIATGLVIAYTLVLAGLASLAAIAGDKSTGGKVAHAAFGLLALAAGAFLLFLPMDGAVGLVWLVSALLAASGFADLLSARRAVGQRAFRTLLGLINIAIGVYALFLVPADAVEILALLIGISLVLRGLLLAMLALVVRKLST